MGTGMRTGSTGPGGRQLLIDLKTRKPPAVPSYVEAYNTIVRNLSRNACINLHASHEQIHYQMTSILLSREKDRLGWQERARICSVHESLSSCSADTALIRTLLLPLTLHHDPTGTRNACAGEVAQD